MGAESQPRGRRQAGSVKSRFNVTVTLDQGRRVRPGSGEVSDYSMKNKDCACD